MSTDFNETLPANEREWSVQMYTWNIKNAPAENNQKRLKCVQWQYTLHLSMSIKSHSFLHFIWTANHNWVSKFNTPYWLHGISLHLLQHCVHTFWKWTENVGYSYKEGHNFINGPKITKFILTERKINSEREGTQKSCIMSIEREDP